MKRAQSTEPKMVILTPLLGQIGGLLGQWPTSYNVKKCPESYKRFVFYKSIKRIKLKQGRREPARALE